MTINIFMHIYIGENAHWDIYCVEIWGNASAIHLDPLIKIQKKRIRAITFSEFSAPSAFS